MPRRNSIILLALMGLLIFPWDIVCIAHPLGHTHHHDPAHPTPCELRKMYKGDGPAWFPPMHCQKLTVNPDEFQVTETHVLKPMHVQLPAIIPAELKLRTVISEEHSYLLPPEPKCRSATIFGDHSLRGPPLS